MSDEKVMVKCNDCRGHRSILDVGDLMRCHNCNGTNVTPQGNHYYFAWPRDRVGPFERYNDMSDTALTPFSDKSDVTVDLRAAELSFLIYLLERGSMSARSHMESGSAHYAQVCDRLLRKLTDLEGTTEERFDRAVAEILKRG